jgi:hypothetical protein
MVPLFAALLCRTWQGQPNFTKTLKRMLFSIYILSGVKANTFDASLKDGLPRRQACLRIVNFLNQFELDEDVYRECIEKVIGTNDTHVYMTDEYLKHPANPPIAHVHQLTVKGLRELKSWLTRFKGQTCPIHLGFNRHEGCEGWFEEEVIHDVHFKCLKDFAVNYHFVPKT